MLRLKQEESFIEMEGGSYGVGELIMVLSVPVKKHFNEDFLKIVFKFTVFFKNKNY